MTLVDLIALGLATAGVVDTWRNGSIFADARATVEDRPGVVAELFRCAFCLTRQVPAWFLAFCYVPAVLLAADGRASWAVFVKLPIYFFAAGEIAWLLNILRGPDHGYDRTNLRLQDEQPADYPADPTDD